MKTLLDELGLVGPVRSLSSENLAKYKAAITRRYRNRHPERAKKCKLESELKHREAKLIRIQQWHAKNKDREREYKKRRFQNHDVKKRHSQTNTEWIKRNAPARLAQNLRVRIWELINRKNDKSKKMGLSSVGLRKHLESKFLPGMTWENYGKGWHIDHIIPCSAFDLTNPEHVKFCFSLSNLQPLWAKDNISKSDKIPKGVVLPFEIKAV